MIIPLTPEELSKATDAEVVKAYLDIGFDQKTAEAYLSMLGRGERAARTEAMTAMAGYTKSRVLSVESARDLALKAGHTEFLAEVNKSAENNIAFIKLTDTPEGIALSAPTEAGVAWFIGKGDDYIPLADLGESSDLTLAQTRKLVAVTNEVASRHTALHGVIEGTTPFIPGLVELQADLIQSLAKAGLPVVKENFHPHIVREGDDSQARTDVAVSNISAAVGPYRYDAPIKSAEGLGAGIAKSVDEKRFTLAPMYVPGKYDSQGDWADPDDLQSALWKFSRGDKMIALQHKPEAGSAGEAVEMMVMPWEHTVPMFKADGTSENVTFPAGTPWLGVIWKEEVWPLVKSGKVRGYSIGGKANLLNVDLPTAE